MSVAERIRTGAVAMGVVLPVASAEGLAKFLALLDKWNRVHNLTAVREQERMIGIHILDSLAIVPFLGQGTLLDIGSGAGLPAVPVAVARADLRVTALDALEKRVAFVNQVIAELGLDNLRAEHGRAEDFRPPRLFDAAVSRAFSDAFRFAELARPLVRKGGRILAMKGKAPGAELTVLPAGIKNIAVHHLAVPEVDGQRHLIEMEVE